MTSYDATTARCQVFTLKDGLLARAAHDLHLRVERFSIEVDDAREWVRATFDATSLEVVATISDGGVEETLKPSDLEKIRGHINDDVLHSREHPQITFVSTKVTPVGDGFMITGNLTINGRQKRQSIDVVSKGDNWVAHATVHQPDFGITPFKALMGAIRIKPDVRVTVSVPKSAE